MTRYGPLGLLGSLFTRGFRLCPPLRTAHPHAGPGAHASHCSAQSPGAGPRVAMPWEALSPAIYPLPPPSLTCCLSAVTSLNWTVGRFISPLSHLDQEGELCSMAVGLCWLPLRHPLHAPAPALYWGMMPLTPVSTASSWTQDALITPLPPHCHPNTMVQTGGKTPRSQVPSGPAAIDTITPTAPNAVTTPPPARGLGGHPWSYNASSCFFGECKTTCLPLSRVTNAKVEHRPTRHRGYYHR